MQGFFTGLTVTDLKGVITKCSLKGQTLRKWRSWWEHTAKAETLNPVYRASFRGRVRSSASHPGTPQVFNKCGLRDLPDVQSYSPSSVTVKGPHVGEPCAVDQEVEM